MRFILTDLKRIFTEPAFYISLVLGLLLYFGAFAFLLINGGTDRLYLMAQSMLLPFVAPLLAAMPYSVMIMQEKETCYSSLMKIKLRKRGYQLKDCLPAAYLEQRCCLFHS